MFNSSNIIARTVAIVATTFAIGATAFGAGQAQDRATVADPIGSSVRVLGCETEDSCVADYRQTRDGAAWVIRRHVP